MAQRIAAWQLLNRISIDAQRIKGHGRKRLNARAGDVQVIAAASLPARHGVAPVIRRHADGIGLRRRGHSSCQQDFGIQPQGQPLFLRQTGRRSRQAQKQCHQDERALVKIRFHH